MTGDVVPKRVTIHETIARKEENNKVNCVFRDDQDIDIKLSEQTLDRLQSRLQEDVDGIFELYTLELMEEDNTPIDIYEAIYGPEGHLWTDSAVAEVNNFLKRGSWRFVRKAIVIAMGRKPIGVKWVFKKKNEPDFSIRYKTRVVTKGYMQIPGIDFTEKFSPVAQPTTLRIILVMILWLFWGCELVDIEAAFLEGRLKVSTFIDLPPGLVELGFMTQEEYDVSCIELQ